MKTTEIKSLEEQLKQAKKNQQIITQSFLDSRKEGVMKILQNQHNKRIIEGKHSIDGDRVWFEFWHYTGNQDYMDRDICYYYTVFFNLDSKYLSVKYTGSIGFSVMNELNDYLTNKLS